MKAKVSDHEYEEFQRFAQEFASESDRAAVILGAAKLDILLYQIIQRYLVPDASSSDEMLDGDGPLSTFSSRIKIAYRLGLIDKTMAKALNLVRRIRNSFAHELSGIGLNSGAHKDRIKELAGPLKAYPYWGELLLHGYFKDCPGPAGEFRAVVAIMSLRLEGLFETTNAVDETMACSLIPPSWKEKKVPVPGLLNAAAKPEAPLSSSPVTK